MNRISRKEALDISKNTILKAEKSRADSERIYPCDKCGKLRSKAEGGTCFSLCDECWEKHYHSKKGDSTIPDDLNELHKKLADWVTEYKDVAERHALAESPKESADYLITLFQPIIERLKEEIRGLKETSFICPICKVEKPKYLQSDSGYCYECNKS